MTKDITKRATPKKLVLSLVRVINEAHSKVQSINGIIGHDVKDAVENMHLHSGALKLVAKLTRMDAEKRDDFLRAYHLYWAYANGANLFGEHHIGDLVDDAEAGVLSAETTPLGDVVANNIRKLRSGIKKLPEDEESANNAPCDVGDAEGSYVIQP